MGHGEAVPLVTAVAVKAKAGFRDANLTLMADSLRDLGAKLASGEIDAAAFEARAWREISTGAAAGYRFAFGGPLGYAEVGELNDLLTAQRAYFDNFLKDVGAADDLGFVSDRASLYRAAGVQADSLGHLAAAGDGDVIEWQGPDGPEACPDCLQYIGTYTAAEFRALGAYPGSVSCGGRDRCSIVRGG